MTALLCRRSACLSRKTSFLLSRTLDSAVSSGGTHGWNAVRPVPPGLARRTDIELGRTQYHYLLVVSVPSYMDRPVCCVGPTLMGLAGCLVTCKSPPELSGALLEAQGCIALPTGNATFPLGETGLPCRMKTRSRAWCVVLAGGECCSSRRDVESSCLQATGGMSSCVLPEVVCRSNVVAYTQREVLSFVTVVPSEQIDLIKRPFPYTCLFELEIFCTLYRLQSKSYPYHNWFGYWSWLHLDTY